MTVADYQNVLRNQIKNLKSDKIMKLAVYSVNQKRIERIFQDGKTSQGIRIGEYNSTTPVYIRPEDAPKAVKLGGKPQAIKGKRYKNKTGVTFKSTEKNPETAYYPSYKAFRKAMGRETGFVNIRLNNRLQSDLANSTISKATTNLADNKPIKVDNHRYIVTLKNQENIDKIQFLEKKYGSIIDLTKTEVSFYHDILEKEFRLALAK
jgi:hypothetical protein